MKKLLLLLLIAPVLGFGQQNYQTEGNTYTKVIHAKELSQADIHQKLNEFIALNFKSANDVIQLNTPSKIICKGNFILNAISSISGKKTSIPFRCGANFIFSIKDNRYKVDIEAPTSVKNTLNNDEITNMMPEYGQDRFTTKEEFSNFYVDYSKAMYEDSGMSEKQINKIINKYLIPEMDVYFGDYIQSLNNWDTTINELFERIEKSTDYTNKDNW